MQDEVIGHRILTKILLLSLHRVRNSGQTFGRCQCGMPNPRSFFSTHNSAHKVCMFGRILSPRKRTSSGLEFTEGKYIENTYFGSLGSCSTGLRYLRVPVQDKLSYHSRILSLVVKRKPLDARFFPQQNKPYLTSMPILIRRCVQYVESCRS